MSDLVTVLESGDIVLLALAKAALEKAGIRFITEGENIQDLFGMGRVVTGFNAVTGAPRIRVTPDHAQRAREILADFK